jgi:hypothetical protein
VQIENGARRGAVEVGLNLGDAAAGNYQDNRLDSIMIAVMKEFGAATSDTLNNVKRQNQKGSIKFNVWTRDGHCLQKRKSSLVLMTMMVTKYDAIRLGRRTAQARQLSTWSKRVG